MQPAPPDKPETPAVTISEKIILAFLVLFCLMQIGIVVLGVAAGKADIALSAVVGLAGQVLAGMFALMRPQR